MWWSALARPVLVSGPAFSVWDMEMCLQLCRADVQGGWIQAYEGNGWGGVCWVIVAGSSNADAKPCFLCKGCGDVGE